MPKSSRKPSADRAAVTETPFGAFRQLPYITLGIVIIATLFVYMPSLKNGFMYGWDDGLYIEDPFVKNLTGESIGHFFSSFYLGMYQPLAVLSISMNGQGGSDAALPYHLTNLFLHIVNIVLVFYLFRKLTNKLLPTVIAALLFGIHPMHVEAVAWISARSTLLFTLFYLLALIFYLRSFDKNYRKNLAWTYVFFLLSAFSKSMAVTLPIVLLLIDYWKGRKFTRAVILEKVPFFIISLIFGIVSVKAAGSYGHITALAEDYNILDRFFMLTYGIAFYPFKAIGPVVLSGIYAFPFKEGGWLPVMYYLSPLLIIAFVALVYYLKPYRKELIFGLLVYLATISVVLPFYWSRFFIVAERYSYLTYIGFYFIMALALDRLLSSSKPRLRKLRPYFAGLLVVILVLFGLASTIRMTAWKDARYLLNDVIIYNKSDASRAAAYFYRGNFRDMTRDFAGAIKDYDMAIGKNDKYIIAYNNRGIVKGITGDAEGALADFSKAIELKPDYADAYYNRGLANKQAGNMEAACSDWQKAAGLGKEGVRRFIDQYCR